jgi:HSP20 family molecular chaperone IbpA
LCERTGDLLCLLDLALGIGCRVEPAPDEGGRDQRACYPLHIGAERKVSQEHTDDEKSYRSEFRYGSFSRNLRLPRGVDGKSVKARYADGILEVRIPWPESKSDDSEKVTVSRD